ncbi:ShlB/FhaC/HecB family hemolysin secretion/activation protein [Falsiroseomonas sp.]|uniref:ShlB/FhaC/HecB family hemolysin secretion/activation protein n=1 Tax=Falsiroseomonas sp. TaxID=2870721 RepID=UPI00356858A3
MAQPLPAPPPPQQGVIERVAPRPVPRLGPSLQPPEAPRATGPGAAATVHVLRTAILGNTALSEAELRALAAGLEGETVPLARIEDARLAMLGAYRRAGYPYVAVTAGLVPVPGGVELRFAATEGFVAEVRLEGDIGPAGAQALRFLERVVGQRPVTTAALERALLLTSDIPGVAVSGVLRPLAGEAGALQLVVQLTRAAYSGYISLDNRGYELTGPWQGLLVAGLNSFTEFGERTEIAWLQAESNEQTFVQISEAFFLGGSGLRFRAYVGGGNARPGSVLAAIGYSGDTWVGGAGLAYPIIRSRPLNLSVLGQFDVFEGTVDLGLPDVPRTRDSVRALRLGLDASARDTLLAFAPAAAATSGLLRLSNGISDLGASDGSVDDVSRPGSEFGFTKIAGEVTRVQPLFEPTSGWLFGVAATLAGQWSDDALPPSERFYLGGTRLGRGFYAGQVTGDKAFGVSAELQLSTGFNLDLGAGETRFATQFYLFRDFGRAWQNEVPGGPAELPDSRLSSWGGGARFVINEWLQFDIEVAHRVTRQPQGAGVEKLDANAVFGRALVQF